ncbi:two-component system, OmpR family, response regulator/two-component system, OmpR family, response regulator QseB [Acinetobacter marinus]|uniref:Two-component system, OmpR family, response regulator/two-component system, OmpR family, response regulator QseB n=2 Tax=Acinetobacter marinus TaxID=281375 RepID=A0A1G6MJS0_9GAMM|nr:two-component system, OmpR family, response regulator/two-component system, OmpR family, response regulator QseB [Acinetobacter marinus]
MSDMNTLHQPLNILLIEDDFLIAQSVQQLLELENMKVHWVNNGMDGLNHLQHFGVDLVLLDIGLPSMNGFEVLRKIRQRNQLPVIVISARDQIRDRLDILQNGGDDYLVKPFDFDELIARIYAVIRRSRPEHQLISESLSYLDLRMDLSTHQAYWKMEMVDFSKKEWLLLESFLSTPYKIFSKSELEEKLYQEDDDIQSNTVEVYIHKLRQKLDKHFIKTIRGIGYKLGDDLSQ